MKYYNILNESFNKLNHSKDSLIKKEDLEVLSMDSIIKSLVQQIADKIRDCVVVDNTIYEIIEGFNVEGEDGNPIEVEKGVFSVYEFKGNKVYNYETKPETLEDIEQIGVKPMSYFIKPNPVVHESIREFLEWHDYFFGPELFDFRDNAYSEPNELIELVKAVELNITEDLQELELEKIVYFNEVDGALVATKDFKDMMINFLKENSPDREEMELFSNGFYEMNAYSDDALPLLLREYDSKWVIYYERMPDREEYQNSLDYGIDYSFTMYINNTPFDYISREFVMTFLEKKPEGEQEELTEDNEEDEDLLLMSPEEVKQQIEEEGDTPYELLGDTLFTHYQYLLPEKLSDLYNVTGISGRELEKSPVVKNYIKEKLLKDFKTLKEEYGGEFFYNMEVDDLKYRDINVSKDFIRDCFLGNVTEYFNNWTEADLRAKDYVDFIDENNLKKLSELGITKEFIKDCAWGEVDEEDPNSDICQIIDLKILSAAAMAEASGSERAALIVFDKEFKNALPVGTSHNSYDITDNLEKKIVIKEEFILDNMDLLYERIADYNETLNTALIELLLTYINDMFAFHEPRYGFSWFDKDEFNSLFNDYSIPDIKEKIEEKDKK